jgi:hypothetical protein
MTRAEAQVLLTSIRPGGPEVNHPQFAEAVALAESDPVLMAWWQAQQDFDRKVAAKLGEVPVPADLRERLLSRGKITPFRPPMQYSWWLAAAAAVAVLCVSTTLWRISNYGPIPSTDLTAQLLPSIQNDSPKLAMFSSDHTKLLDWLKSQHAPVGDMPTTLATMTPIGCQTYHVHGHTVSLICFTIDDKTEAHLFTIDKSALKDPFQDNVPNFIDMEGWHLAVWSDRTMSYVLATHADPDMLKHLLSWNDHGLRFLPDESAAFADAWMQAGGRW